MPKIELDCNVLEAAKQRIGWTFDTFPKIYASFSGGKDSTVMVHLIAEEARKRNRKFALFFLDWEVQFTLTIQHVEELYLEYSDVIEPYWVALPIKTWNGCSSHEPEWTAWDIERKNLWARQPNRISITDESFFSFYYRGIMFEEFVPLFGQWYANGELCACFVGVRAQESLNRFRIVSRHDRKVLQNKMYTANVVENVWNVYPIYDWRTEDIWTYLGKTKKKYNRLYDRMYQSGMTIHQMRICEPFGDTQRQSLWLYQAVEPTLWAKMVLRVAGANTGKMYANERGSVMGNHHITLPDGHTWESFAILLLETTPPKTAEHYKNKIAVYIKWWQKHGYDNGIPDESNLRMENEGKAPSWRRICKTILKNDYWCKYMGFSPTKTAAYDKYITLMKRRREQWGIFKEV